MTARDAAKNLEKWVGAIAPPPPARMLWPSLQALTVVAVLVAASVASMFVLDTAVTAWARSLPQGVRDVFEQITNFGLSGWFLIPSAALVLVLAAAASPALSRVSQGVLVALAARIGFVFLAVGVPGLFVTVVKGLIGRARPFVAPHDDPFTYMPFVWHPAYASMPSGHSTTAVSAALAIGALWPRSRAVMWIYALIIMASRVIVLAHHTSDVIAGALTGAAGVWLVRRWFAAHHRVFSPGDLRSFPGPSWRRVRKAVGEAMAAAGPIDRRRNAL